jgi:hypothetical protein
MPRRDAGLQLEKALSDTAELKSAPRAAALRKCSAIAARYPESTWGDMEIDQYRAYMAEHGQVE